MQSWREDSITISPSIMTLLVKTSKARGNSRQTKRSFFESDNSVTYSDNIILFVLWIFDTRGEFLAQEYIPELEAMNHEELLDLQLYEEDRNLTNRRKINPINEVTGNRNLKGQIFDAIHPLRSGISYNSPIKIDGEGAITYEVF